MSRFLGDVITQPSFCSETCLRHGSSCWWRESCKTLTLGWISRPARVATWFILSHSVGKLPAVIPPRIPTIRSYSEQTRRAWFPCNWTNRDRYWRSLSRLLMRMSWRVLHTQDPDLPWQTDKLGRNMPGGGRPDAMRYKISSPHAHLLHLDSWSCTAALTDVFGAQPLVQRSCSHKRPCSMM